MVSVLLLSVKACLFTVTSQLNTEAASFSPSRHHRLHLKKSWGMPVLFLSSVVFALGHTVVAYVTSCRARRKILYHRVDPEAVSLLFFFFFCLFYFLVFAYMECVAGSFMQEYLLRPPETPTVSHSYGWKGGLQV